MTQERIWTCPEIALLLGVSRQAVSRWVRTGKIRATVITVGARPIYRIRDALGAPIEYGAQQIRSDASIGVALARMTDDTTSLVDRADAAT